VVRETGEALSIACGRNSTNHTRIVGLLLPYVIPTTDITYLYKEAIRSLHVGAIKLLLSHCKRKIHKFGVNRMIRYLEKTYPLIRLFDQEKFQAKQEILSLLQEYKKNEYIFSLDCSIRYLSYLS
jgi:hypothetical protein